MTVLRSGSATDVGRVRGSNQDLTLEVANLFAVADGMGGHAGGEVAARVAVDALRSAFSRQPSTDGLREAVAEANAAVWRTSQVQSDLRGMGTTLTAVALVSGADGRDVVALANVGDSRAYVFSEGHISQVTSDHSLAEEKVRSGELTEAEAAVHPHRHILTRALGVSSDVDVDLWELHLHDGDRILLCSDGLTNEVAIDQLAEVLGGVPDPTAAARLLVQTANEHGGNDNITVVVVDVLVGEQNGVGVPGALPVAGVAAGIASVPPPIPPALDAPRTNGPVDRTSPDDALTAVVPSQPSDDVFVGSGTIQQLPTTVVPGAAPVGTEAWDQPIGQDPEQEEKLSRGAARRRAGIPRRVTFRVIGFFILLIAVVAGGYYLLKWYANDDWYVTLHQNELVIYRGHPGGVLWFRPKVVDRTGVTTDEVLFIRIHDLNLDVEEPSLAAAKHYAQNLVQEKQAQQQLNSGQSGGPSTTVIGPTGTFPVTTLPPSTTSPPASPTTPQAP